MKTSLLHTFSAALLLLGAGCGTAAHRIEPGGSQALITVRDVNTQDWQNVAARSIQSLLASGVLNRADGRKTVVMVSEVKDRTGRQLKTTILTNKIRQALLGSGKAVTTTAVGAAGAEDTATRQVRELENDDLFNQATVQKRGTVIAPDMSLSGEILREMTTSGRTEESYFVFHMVLTDLATGLAVWEQTFDFSKQETASILGF